MDKQPVGTLPDLTASSLDDEIMIITDSEHNQLKKEKISDFITDLTSTNENNALTKGTDGKMFVTDFGNASNITEGTLPTSVLPEIPLEKIPDIPKDKLPSIETSDLPVSGVTADTYAYPSSVTVNAQGMVTAISEGTPSGVNADTDLSNLTATGEKHFVNKTQITNCILEAPNGVATFSGSTITVKAGLKVLIPNGRNADGTLNNIEYTLQSDVSVSLPSDRNGVEFIILTNNGELSYWSIKDVGYIYKEPQSNLNWKYYDEDNNIYKYTINGAPYVDSLEVPILLANVTNGVINSITPYQPVELLKRSDKAEIVGWGLPDYSKAVDIASLSSYTCPSNGWLLLQCQNPSDDSEGYVNYNSNKSPVPYYISIYTPGRLIQTALFPVVKGEILTKNISGGTVSVRFIPMKGADANA